MRNSNRIFFLTLLLPIILFADGFGLCEKGDLIFRTGVVYFGHTGIYCDWNGIGDPSNWESQNIVEPCGIGLTGW